VLKKSRDLAISVVDGFGHAVPEALVCATTQSLAFVKEKTDSAGKTLLRVPSGLALQHVFALKDGVGLDPVFFQARFPHAFRDALAPDSDQPLKFELTGARTVRVHVFDQEHKPIAGIRVACQPYGFWKRAALFSPPNDPVFEPETDAVGVATFRFLPHGNVGVRVEVAPRWVADQRMVPADPTSRPVDVDMTVYRRERVTGSVETVNGKPAVGATVEIGGSGGYRYVYLGQTVTTDASGAFGLWLAPEAYYEFEARGDKTIAPLQKLVIRVGEPVQPLSFVIAPATRVHGRIVRAKDKSPAPKRIVFVQTKDLGYDSLPASQRFARPRNLPGGPLLSKHTSTDANGQFEFFLAPGKYVLSWDPVVQLDVTNQKEIVVDLVDKSPSASR
jgi:hypothetical protein